MTVYADAPRWPRHGMLWGHLISDTSLNELHALATRAGIPSRAFDLDHYDWPEGAEDALRAAGVQFIESTELVRRLRASGLRIRGADRAAARRERTARHAAHLGIPAPTDLILGLIGHVDPLPDVPGAFRVTSDGPHLPPRIQAVDSAGRAAAEQWLQAAHAAARHGGAAGFVGQALVVPGASSAEAVKARV